MWHEALLGKIIGDGIQLFVSIDSLFFNIFFFQKYNNLYNIII